MHAAKGTDKSPLVTSLGDAIGGVETEKSYPKGYKKTFVFD